MENSIKNFEVQKISFMAGTEELSIFGKSIAGNLTYETEIRVNSSYLNMLLNNLQKLNPEVYISDIIQSEELPNGDLFYAIDTNDIESILPIETLCFNDQYRQIRA